MFLDGGPNAVHPDRMHLYYPEMEHPERQLMYRDVELGTVPPEDPQKGYPDPSRHPFLDDWVEILLHYKKYSCVNFSKDKDGTSPNKHGYLPLGTHSQNKQLGENVRKNDSQDHATGATEDTQWAREKFPWLDWDPVEVLQEAENSGRYMPFDPLRPCTWSFWGWLDYFDIEEFRPQYPSGKHVSGKHAPNMVLRRAPDP